MATEDGEVVATADYRRVDDVTIVHHVGTRPDRRNQGIAGQLTQFVLDDHRERGQRVVPRCPYVAGWIERNHEYQDLVADQRPSGS